MGVVSDKIIEFVKEKVNAKNAAIVGGVAVLIAKVRSGEAQDAYEQLKEWKDKLDEAEQTVEEMEMQKEQLESGLETAEATYEAAVVTEKTATVGASLNPVAAALAVAQKYVIDLANKEIEDMKGAINGILPNAIDKTKATVKKQKEKIDDFIREYEEKIRLAKLRAERNKV
jgi:gas vesicle protein